MDRPLEIEGELLIEFEGGSARIDIRDETVDIRLPGARSALALTRQVSTSTRRDGLRRADAALRAAGLKGRVRIRGRTVALLGGNDRPGPIARLLGLDPMALSLFAFLGSVFDRRRAPDRPGAGPGP
jgi:hypothetical protein